MAGAEDGAASSGANENDEDSSSSSVVVAVAAAAAAAERTSRARQSPMAPVPVRRTDFHGEDRKHDGEGSEMC